MNRRRRISALLFVLASVAPRLVAAEASLDRVLQLNAAARGGTAAFEQLSALRLQLVIEEPEFIVSATYVARREGFMRIDVFAEGERVFSEALGPEGGWQWRAGDGTSQPLSAAGEAALRRGLVSNLYALYQWPGKGVALRLLDNAGSANAWEVVASFPDGFEQHLFVNRATHRVTRRSETSALHPDLDARERAQHTEILKWLEVGGMRFPQSMRKYDSDSGALLQESEVLAAEVFRASEPLPAAFRTSNFTGPHSR